MPNKAIVHFDELPVFPYRIDYLTYCKHCKTYNLGNKACVKCGYTDERSLDKVAQKSVIKQLVKREILIILCYMLLFLGVQDIKIRLMTFIFSGICLGLNLIIYKKYQEELTLKEMDRYIQKHMDEIKEDLGMQLQKAIQDIEDGNLVEAYDRFRYLSKLIDNDEVRTYKLICLKNFKLRSDMPLELKELLQQEWNTFLVDYIYEISKIRKDLVDDATLQYIVEHKEQILAKHKGEKIMASVLAGALKSKFLFTKYAEEMPGYLKFFSRDRLLRLCKMNRYIKDSELRYKLLFEVRDIVGGDIQFKEYF